MARQQLFVKLCWYWQLKDPYYNLSRKNLQISNQAPSTLHVLNQTIIIHMYQSFSETNKQEFSCLSLRIVSHNNSLPNLRICKNINTQQNLQIKFVIPRKDCPPIEMHRKQDPDSHNPEDDALEETRPHQRTKLGQVNNQHKHNRSHTQDSEYADPENDRHLLMEILRVRSQEKQKRALEVFELDDERLQQFFTEYRFHESLNLNMGQLLSQSQKLKLVRNTNRVYFGEVENGRKHGVGVAVYSDGRLFEGYFQDNEKHGPGFEIYPNCNVYMGTFEKNKKHGNGSFYWFTVGSISPMSHEDVQFYEGEWWGGLPSGRGFHQRANGDRYQGYFRNGLKYGQGCEWFSNGDQYKGEYVNGLPEGYGEYIWLDGSNYRGDFKQGVRNGFGIWKKDNRKRTESYRGHYLLDRKSGYGIYVWENGDYYKGQFFQDLRNGYGEFFRGTEKVYAGMWEQGQEAPHLAPLKRKNKFDRQFKVTIRDLSQGDLNYSTGKPQYGKKSTGTTGTRIVGSSVNHNNLSEVQWEETEKKRRKNLSSNGIGNPEKIEPPGRRTRVGHRNCIPHDIKPAAKKVR